MGSKAVSQGYPRITSSLPRFVIRKRRVFVSVPVRTCKSVKCLIAPSWLWVPSTFHILIGVSTGRYPIRSRWSRFFEMKLSVAPESTRTSLSAVACADSNRTGIRIDRYLLLYTLIRNALAQAAGFRRLRKSLFPKSSSAKQSLTSADSAWRVAMRACAFCAALTGPWVWTVTTGVFDVDASATLVFLWGQFLAMCPLWLHWKQSPLWTRCRFSSSVKVARALVRPMSIAFGLRLLSAFLHCGFVAPPLLSFPLTLSLKNMYSCWCFCADAVQSFHVTGWSNLTQLATSLNGRALWNTSRVASPSRSYPAFFAVVANWAMKLSKSSPFILRSLMLCWAFCFSAMSVYAWRNLVSMVRHRFSSAWGTPPVV